MAFLSIFVALSAKCSCKSRTSRGCGIEGMVSDCDGPGGGSGCIAASLGDASEAAGEEKDVGEISRVVLRLGGGCFVGFDGFEVNGFEGKSSLASESSSRNVPLSSLSTSSLTTVVGLLCFGGGGFTTLFGAVLSDSVVDVRGTFDGRNGLNGGAFLFEAG